MMEKSLDNLAKTAIHELLELAHTFQAGDADRARRWVAYNSRKARRKEKDVLRGLAGMVVAEEPDTGLFRYLEIDDDATTSDVMAGRIVTALLNDDAEMVTALIDVWATWTPEGRGEVLMAYLLRLTGEVTDA